MKAINRTYKFRIYPTREQEALLAKHFGHTRFVYNYFLAERKHQYDETGKSDGYNEQAATLTRLKALEKYAWLKEVNSQSLQHALRHLDSAYTNFFRGYAEFPKFKSRKSRNSFTVPQHVSLVGGRIKFPKFTEGIKVKVHRPFNGPIKHITVSRTASGKYYVSICSIESFEPKQKTNASVGIDLGLKDLLITSDGRKYAPGKFIKRYEKRLATAQRHLSRKVKDSHAFERQRKKVALIQEKIANCRVDKLHKISNDIVRNYDVICCESLAVKNMMRNHKLSKHISDASWGTLLSMLAYKAEWNDCRFVQIGRMYPSSQTCHCCGYVNREVKDLKVRHWTCPNCGAEHDRDINASINILAEGLKSASSGTGDYKGGDCVRLARKQRSVKPEAQPSLVVG